MKIEEFMDGIGDYPTKTLRSLIEFLEIECEKRENERYEELVKSVCTSIANLLKEFPGTEFPSTIRCEECGCSTTINALGAMRYTGITPDNFKRN